MSSHHDSNQLGQRIRALVDHHISDDVRTRHLAAIDAELAHQPQTPSNEPTIHPSARWRPRRWLAGLAATATVLAPGVAVAAHDALPGDTLYGVKRATEQLHMIVTPHVAARNRIAELAALLERDTSPGILTAASDAARDAVTVLPDGHPLHDELAALLARIPDPQGRDAAPPPPSNTLTDDEREPDDEDHSEPDDRDEPEHHDEPDRHEDDTDDGADSDGLHDDTTGTDDADDLDDETDESDQDVEQDDHTNDGDDDEHESRDASSAEYDDSSDEADD